MKLITQLKLIIQMTGLTILKEYQINKKAGLLVVFPSKVNYQIKLIRLLGILKRKDKVKKLN